MKLVKPLGVIAVGGMVGSLARWAIASVMDENSFPWATLLVNYIGAVLLALLIVYAEEHAAPKWWWRPLLGTGFCGGFTTYSAFAVQVDGYLTAGQSGRAIAYILASLIGTYLLVLITVSLTRKQMSK
ncbi:MAG: fluoride efflux transporter CrcB [Actinobacteria bacterium]|nr:fluoride efflux transporter CrcB [Actinomycetota bacterium]NBP92223.1 fluoride efflux transporter CrcB [Actinomycetota bacterium]